jgi:cellulase/cellobiase CelA1
MIRPLEAYGEPMRLLKGGILVVAAITALIVWQLPSMALNMSGKPSLGSSFSPSPSASPSPSPSLPSPAPSGPVSCSVTYTVLSSWSGSFEAEINIANTGPDNITPWELTWNFPGDQQITSMQNAIYVQSGENETTANVSYDAEISVNSAIGIFFSGTYTNSDASPASFSLNGTPCTT